MPVPALVVIGLLVAALGALTVAALALVHVFWGWGLFFFYVVPALFFFVWSWREFSPATWRRSTARFRRAFRQSRLGPPPPRRTPPPPPRPDPCRDEAQPAGAGGRLVRIDREILQNALRPFLELMRIFLAAWRSPHGRRVLNVVFGVGALGIAGVVAWGFASTGWPLDRANVALTAAAGALFLATFAFKALGWQRLFRAYERPRSLALAAATGAASVSGLALPGRFDDAIRVAIVHKLPGRRPAVGTVVLSLFLLGMIDAAALAPFASTAAIASSVSLPVRIAFAVVAGAGLGAGIVVAALPRIGGSARAGRFRVTHWLNRHSPASPRDASWAWALVAASWLARVAAIYLLLGALGFRYSFPLAAAYLSAGAASGALPISPAGAATQAGIGAAVLAAAGVDAAQAVAFGVAAQVLTVAAGALVVVFATLLAGARRLLPFRG